MPHDRFNVDLVGDYAGSELFLIDGNALLLHVFSSPMLDFSQGFQLLHAVYLIERFLSACTHRKCNFSVVFLDDFKDRCVPQLAPSSWRYLLAREVVIKHLVNTPGGKDLAQVFPSFDDLHFRAYLDRTRPLFIMCHCEPPLDRNDTSLSEEGVPQSLKAGHCAERWTNLGFNLALIDTVKIRENKVFVDVLQWDQIHDPDYLKDDLHGSEQHADTPEEDIECDVPLLSARESVSVAAVAHLLCHGSDVDTANFASVFLLHTALQSTVLFSHRRLQPVNSPPLSAVTFLQEISTRSTRLLRSPHAFFEGKSNDIADYIDGTLFFNLLCNDVSLSSSISAKYSELSNAVHAITQIALQLPSNVSFVEAPDLSVSVVRGVTASSNSPRLLPFQNVIFDPYLQDVKISSDSLPTSHDPKENGKAIYREQYHWHNSHKPLIYKAPSTSRRQPVHRTGKGNQGMTSHEKRLAGRAHKSNQIYLSIMFRYAASLTGSVDGTLGAKTIVVDDTPPPKERHGEKKVVEKQKPTGPSKKVKPGSKSADIIRQENQAKKSEAVAQKLVRAWSTFLQNPAAGNERMLDYLDDWVSKNKPQGGLDAAAMDTWHFIEVEARLYKVRLLQRTWADLIHDGKRESGYPCVSQLFDESRRILKSPGLTRKVYKIIKNVFKGLKIEVPPIFSPDSLPKQKLNPVFGDWDGDSVLTTRLDMSSEEFQLMHCGPLMDRDMDSAPDSRVPFEPDGWQRRVLDEIDKNNSTFVVAPTSAGKTFIAFYAMEKVLKTDDDSILVYVAPTKALVNQIAAEVISRFSKNYKHPGKTTWAIHTRDYRVNNPNTCQILVTVPHILQIMLLSPTNATTWAPKVKWIIFDEVHSIGNAEDGLVWEQLLLMAQCPIIALSATVGNPDEFSSWLDTTQGSQGTDFKAIYHPHRYSDLRKYIYTSPNNKSPIALDAQVSKFASLETCPDAKYIHPLVSVNVNTQELPPDLTFEARDCLLVYNAMQEAANDAWPLDESLHMEAVFGREGRVIKKADVVKWEISLKELLHKWLQDRNSPFRKVVEILKARQHTSGKHQSSALNTDKRAEGYLHRTIFPLLQSLHSSNALPAIVFQYSRVVCERLCRTVCLQLASAEAKFKKTDSSFLRKVEEHEKRLKAKPQKNIYQLGNDKAAAAREVAEDRFDSVNMFSPADYLPEYSFADYRKYTKEELQKDCTNLIRWGIHQDFVIALKRGIGVHHSGMNRKYRQLVEMLFRKGFLRVVIATGTLALGINMPTKTSVFSGDSVFLTALNYRQAAGRAGRRGFDNLGNVVFHGISQSQVFRLMSSKLPSLLGHFPINVSLILRTFILLHNSDDSEYAKRTIDSLLKQNRLILGGFTYRHQVLHHLRFSIEFLRRQGLLAADGKPLNFAGMVTHLYYTENSALALHALLCSGDLQKLCEDVNEKPDSTCLRLMLIMAHLFGRLPGSKDVKRLPDLPYDIRSTLKKENQEIVQVYTTYMQSYAREHLTTPDDRMPLSGNKYGGSLPFSLASPPVTIRSSFEALSGQGDTFSSPGELATTTRDGLFIESTVIPEFPMDPLGETCNSYLYDFYNHGDIHALWKDNGIRKSDIWFKLKDFSLILATVEAGLMCFIRDGPGAYYDFIPEEEDETEVIKFEEGDGEKGEGHTLEVGSEIASDPTLDVSSDSGESTTLGSGAEESDTEDLEDVATSKSFVKVWKAFRLLKTSFDSKFEAMWA